MWYLQNLTTPPEISIYFLSLIGEIKRYIHSEEFAPAHLDDLLYRLRMVILEMEDLPREIKNELALDEIIESFRPMLQQAEYTSEKQSALECLKTTHYFNPLLLKRCRLYNALTQKEIQLLDETISFKKNRLLFVGCGPLPISAFFYALTKPEIHIDLLDRSKEALDLAQDVVKRFALSDRISILPPCDIQDFVRFDLYDITVMASMVGETEKEKESLYKTISSQLDKGSFILTRAVPPHYFSSALYSPFPFETLSLFYKTIYYKKVDPLSINYSILFERTSYSVS